MTRVGIVTDSTCDLTPEELEAMDVRLVPLRVLFGEEAHLDWVELRPEEFYQRLAAAPKLPTTSQPSPADFSAVYSKLAEEGCEEIVSIHLSAALSGTFESATLAAATSPIPVRVVDTRKVSQAAALVVKAAVAERAKGADAAAVEACAIEVSSKMRLFFVLDTLDNLVKGGRAGKAQGLAASLLNIKPVLRVNEDGIIEPFKKARGRAAALTELSAHLAEDSREHGRMRVAYLHAIVPDMVEEVKAAVEASGADVEIDSDGLIGSVVGTYTGPGAVGIAYYPIG